MENTKIIPGRDVTIVNEKEGWRIQSIAPNSGLATIIIDFDGKRWEGGIQDFMSIYKVVLNARERICELDETAETNGHNAVTEIDYLLSLYKK
jgi:hypothetical protein